MRTTVGLRFFGFVFGFAVEIFDCKFSTKLVEFLKNVNLQKRGTSSLVDGPGFFGQPDAINIVFFRKELKTLGKSVFLRMISRK